MKRLRFFLSFIVLLTTLNCIKQENPVIKGQVVTKNGEPVQDAEIHFIYYGQNQRDSASITINVSVVPGDISLKTYRFGVEDLVEVLADGYLSGGSHSFTITDSLYTNGIYLYELASEDTVLSHKIFMNKTADHLISTAPFRKTNNNGAFRIDIEELGIGEKFEISSEQGPMIIAEFRLTNKFEFLAIKNQTIIARDTVEINEEKENLVELLVE